ncbi:radical SAM protein [Deltaproteobacteria bacterium OttesenSCG-928-K17]|nr:radical SAM protein [Deltaproteobacteria bacterium OttesenSCG-928-K17]
MTAGAFNYTDSRRVSSLVSDRLDPHKILAEEIGPEYQAYRQKWDLARTFRELPPFPLHVDYEMRFKCNLRCPMCLMSLGDAGRARYGQAEKSLSPARVMELIDEGAAAGQKAMGFGGLWEPLLEPDLPAIIAHGRRRGLVDVMFNTNGLLLTEKTGRALIEAGLTRLMISVDAATAGTYAKMRVGSDFGVVTENIERFAALRRAMGRQLPLIRVSFCLTALNEAELPAFMDRWREVVDFFSIQAYGRYDSLNPPDFPGRSASDSSQRANAPQSGDGANASAGKDILSRPPTVYGRCAQPGKRLLVRHNGQVLPCCDASGLGLVVGDINSQSLAEIWAGPELAELRRALAGPRIPDLCRECQEKFGA